MSRFGVATRKRKIVMNPFLFENFSFFEMQWYRSLDKSALKP